jgi:endonuclease YncB( thermonuclease family)
MKGILKMKNVMLSVFLFVCLPLVVHAETLCERIAANPNAQYVGEFEVVFVIDGDTILIQNKKGETELVRFIGVNAPETKYGERKRTKNDNAKGQPLADEATKFISDAIKAANNKVELYREGRDKSYERFLRWVVVKTPKGKRDLSELLVAEGLGAVYYNKEFIPDTKERDILINLEAKAKTAKKGIWSLPPNERPFAKK